MKNNKLFQNLSKIHTTDLGIKIIIINLGIEEEVVSYCKNIILTINASSYTIITAHKKG